MRRATRPGGDVPSVSTGDEVRDVQRRVRGIADDDRTRSRAAARVPA